MTNWRQSRFHRLRRRAFSLVEVVLALGIATFGILIIVALLPVGIQSTKDSLEETEAIDVLSEVIADRQATPFSSTSTVYGLPALTSAMTTATTGDFGIDNNNQFTSTTLSGARYRVDYIVTPPASGSLNPYQAWIKVSWPGPSASPAGSVESVVTFPQP